MDTIYALATARGKAGVAIVRLSGPLAWAAVQQLTQKLPEPRRAALRNLKDASGTLLDQALVVLFEKDQSFTGEEVAELHLHGSSAVVNAVLNELGQVTGLRLADPGEFTRRALENGCLDLAQVEGLADLIEAETEAQRRQALNVLSGAVGERASRWRNNLVRAAALLEATIDFADEDVPVDVTPEVSGLVDAVLRELRAEVAGAKAAERIREGFEVAIIGRPNVGKSTLLNALAGREAAITSEIAGTTRDVIEVRMDLDGLPVTVLDTAGLRDATDAVETIGIERAVKRAAAADLRLFILDETGIPDLLDPQPDDIVVHGKADKQDRPLPRVSGRTGEGLEELVAQISGILSARSTGAVTITRERHRLAVIKAIGPLESVLSALERPHWQAELLAEQLRVGIRALNALVGHVDVEHLLDEIFASFCIGK